ncbi:MAG: hypothetical protein V1908_00435 [Candidatus Peregrinibacteria bacterium]
MQIKRFAITGLLVASFLVTGAPVVQAIYSPEVSNLIAPIRDHIFSARQLNGTGGIGNGVQKIFDDDTIAKLEEADDKARAENQVTGLPGQFHQFRQQYKSDIVKDQFASFAEDFALMFNWLPSQKYYDANGLTIETTSQLISSCLRNDILTLKNLRDQLLRAALQSTLKLNRNPATILMNDYKEVRAMITLLKRYYSNPQFREETPNLFFPEGQTDYYLGDCPEGGFWGEYERAFEDLKRSWGVFATLAFGGGLGQSTASGQWGSIKDMAQARARVRATEYIRSNQISLTIGGPQGGSPTSIGALIRTEGLGGVANLFKTEWQIAKAIIGPITPLFDGTLTLIGSNPCVFYMSEQKTWRACTDPELEELKVGNCDRCRNRFTQRTPLDIAQDLQARMEEKDRDLVSAETAIKFNLSFNVLADANTTELDSKLTELNAIIQSASEAFGEEAGKGLPTLCNELRAILVKHCPNKNVSIPACR